VRVLILAGTAEARELSAALAVRDEVEVLSSLAGAVTRPLLPVGEVRIGGFGGVAGLVDVLQQWRPDVLVDATHPFAAGITRHAVEAATLTRTPLHVLRRPAWTVSAGDRWFQAADITAAVAQVLAMEPGCVFLTTGRRELAAFAPDVRHHYLVRAIEPPLGAAPARMTLLLDRGPYTAASELALMESHQVTVLVTRNSGGTMTSAKLEAARRRGIPVVMVDRPPLPAGIEALNGVPAVLELLVRR
jgi:precorrin-6A/cobalt-precorrin-6A reductase